MRRPTSAILFSQSRLRGPVKGITLHRDAAAGRHPLKDLVSGLEESPPLCELFGGAEGCTRTLENVTVELVDRWGYMWVSDDDGTLFIAKPYWEQGEELHLYLDLVHELVHVKQHHDGRDLYDDRYKYVARPTELEAYRTVVREARRLGMGEAELFEFLHVDWISNEDHVELALACGVQPPEAE